MLKILAIIFRECEVGITNDPARGFSAMAKGPFAVLALVAILAMGMVYLHGLN